MDIKDMVTMRTLNNSTFQEIGNSCGISRQAAKQRIDTYNSRLEKRKKELPLEKIKYKGFYDYFLKNPDVTVGNFAQKVFGYGGYKAKMVSFLLGESNATFTISQMIKMCDIIGKPFEEIFQEC